MVTINPLAFRTTQLYDAGNRQIATLDANAHRTSTVYDAASRVLATIDGNGHRTTNVFDAAGRKIGLIDPRANRNTFTFDPAGREIRRVNPLSQITTLAYDQAGHQTLRLDARGNRTSYAFDPVGRITGRRYPDGTRVTFAFDPVGNRTVMADGTGRYTTTFDALNRTASTVNPASKRVSLAYDAIGERRLTVSPDGDRFTLTWDANQRLSRVVNPQALRTTFGYDTADRRTVKELGNGARTSFTLDNASRVTRLVNIKSSGVTISSFGYQYDKTTRRTGVTEATGDRVTWVYDPAYQLTNERRSGIHSYNVTYTYDPIGNRTLKNDNGALTTSTYDKANRQIYSLDGTGRTTFTFDATGNQTKQTTPALAVTTSVWDFENMNTATITPSSRVTLVYNGDKLRVEKDSSTSGTARFIYDGQNILLETDGSNLTQAVYTLEPGSRSRQDFGPSSSNSDQFGKLISQRQLQMGVWVPIYYAFDALGSTDSLTDSAAVVTDTYTYFAFGKPKATTGSTPNRFTWVGELMYMQDPETGEVQLHLRQTDPNRGRMKSEDPKGLEPDVNRYRIVGNDPVNEIDPSGLDSSSDQRSDEEEIPEVVKLDVPRLEFWLTGEYSPGPDRERGRAARLPLFKDAFAALNSLIEFELRVARILADPDVKSGDPKQIAFLKTLPADMAKGAFDDFGGKFWSDDEWKGFNRALASRDSATLTDFLYVQLSNYEDRVHEAREAKLAKDAQEASELAEAEALRQTYESFGLDPNGLQKSGSSLPFSAIRDQINAAHKSEDRFVTRRSGFGNIDLAVVPVKTIEGQTVRFVIMIRHAQEWGLMPSATYEAIGTELDEQISNRELLRPYLKWVDETQKDEALSSYPIAGTFQHARKGRWEQTGISLLGDILLVSVVGAELAPEVSALSRVISTTEKALGGLLGVQAIRKLYDGDWSGAGASIAQAFLLLQIGPRAIGRLKDARARVRPSTKPGRSVDSVSGTNVPKIETPSSVARRQRLKRLSEEQPRLVDKFEKPANVAPNNSGATGAIPTNPLVARILAKLNLYPKVIDPRTGQNILFPSGIKGVVDKSLRVEWGLKDRAAFIAEWYRRGYPTPKGGWDKYDIHHIQPREFGGTNDFWNLVPVERKTHELFNAFWREFLCL